MNLKHKLLSAALLAGTIMFICGCAGKEEGAATTEKKPATTQSAGDDGGG